MSWMIAAMVAISSFVGVVGAAVAADVPCRFKAETERTEVTIVANGKTWWKGTLDKQETKTVAIPDGPFTVLSRVYNPNLQTHGDVRAEAHTRMCREQVALSVPLFSDAGR